LFANTRITVKFVELPSGIGCRVFEDHLCVTERTLTLDDTVALTRASLTATPLRENDPRLKLVEDIRDSIVKVEASTGRQWLVLDALRRVSMRKWRHRRALAA